KAFQTVTVFIIIPLMLAVHSNKIPLTAALDIIVWYIAISFGIFIFKTPIKLYFTVKDKCKYLKEHSLTQSINQT
ncbi:hypothetical protein SAMD00019534_047630, partial [Acytostelium subglobosum LB1]|uniref:hypothetical protein n=1 Tax=Acytostelium subglobosum LB1 TaxID=1410327 RepID=UPI0006449B97